jgi:hypothetical protein
MKILIAWVYGSKDHICGLEASLVIFPIDLSLTSTDQCLARDENQKRKKRAWEQHHIPRCTPEEFSFQVTTPKMPDHILQIISSS